MEQSTPSDPPCSICPPDTQVTNLGQLVHIPSITDGTCESVASLALGGCFDELHCSFLQGYLKNMCCAPTPRTSSPGFFQNTTFPPTNATISASSSCDEIKHGQTNALPGGANDGKCFVGTSKTLCLENVFRILCFATLDGEKCNSCNPGAPMNQCSFSDFNKPGTFVDCSNVYSNYKRNICSNGEVFLPSSYYSSYQGGSGGGSGGGGGDYNYAIHGLWLVAIFMLRLFCLYRRCQRRGPATTSLTAAAVPVVDSNQPDQVELTSLEPRGRQSDHKYTPVPVATPIFV